MSKLSFAYLLHLKYIFNSKENVNYCFKSIYVLGVMRNCEASFLCVLCCMVRQPQRSTRNWQENGKNTTTPTGSIVVIRNTYTIYRNVFSDLPRFLYGMADRETAGGQ